MGISYYLINRTKNEGIDCVICGSKNPQYLFNCTGFIFIYLFVNNWQQTDDIYYESDTSYHHPMYKVKNIHLDVLKEIYEKYENKQQIILNMKIDHSHWEIVKSIKEQKEESRYFKYYSVDNIYY